MEVEPNRVEALLLLGSNIEPEQNVARALSALGNLPGCTVTAVSSTHVTPALGADGTWADQPAYHNVGVRLTTALSPTDLRRRLRAVEAEQGRVRTEDKFAPRTIDIDIAYFGQLVTEIGGSVIPDPDAVLRRHVAIPLAEIAPAWRHPQSGTTLHQIAQQVMKNEMERAEA